jgi:hypothetical protein
VRTRTVVLAALAIVLLGGLTLYVVWPDPSDEDQVRQAIRDVAEGARNADLVATMKPVSRAYVGDDGVTRDEVKGFLFREYRRRGAITVLLGDIGVHLDGDTAAVEFSAVMADGIDVASFDLLPADADAFQFVVQLEREDGGWKITGSSYQRTGAAGQPMI